MTKINHVKQRLNCLTYLSNRSIEIRVGKNISCPLGTHPDKNPSFGVYEKGENFKCHGCGESGDIIDLAELFNDSLDDLFHSTGGKVSEYAQTFKKQAKKSESLRMSLIKREIDYERISHFIGEEDGYLTIPIVDQDEETIGIQKRKINSHEFKNSGTTKGFFYSPNDEKNDTLFIVEGITDWLTLRQYFPHTFAFVTSNVQNLECENIINQYQKIYWLGDNDEPGEKLKNAFMEKFNRKTIYTLSRKPKQDINDYWQELMSDLKTPKKDRKEVFSIQLDLQKKTLYSPIKSHSVNSYTWGLDCIDKQITSIKKGDLCILAADQNIGKSTFCFWMARENRIKYNHNVVYFSLESTKQEMFHNFSLSYAGVSKIDVRDNEHLNNRYYRQKMEELENNNQIEIIGTNVDEGSTIEDIEKKIYGMEKCDLLIIDNLLSMSQKEKGLSENQQTSQMISKLIAIARECQIPIILVHHYRKSVYKKKTEWHDLSDMYGAMQIKTFAKLIIQVKRDPDAEKGIESSQFDIREGKVRGGGTRDEITVHHHKGNFYETWDNCPHNE